ncbi:hypothetical protein F4V43_11250 [Paenibacillus spiritus]|uniref:Uncharacterized protein n=1 Tax=Paenibacillus spiritus TaxID=2496557 RepID=A0A5J5G948_9BACL|nr:hypothetical protein [Paenibacillus spiritus]KAA9003983.1 hypothetical protein F4V43_11250 [Paenibacillus spiritus]
MYTSNGGISPKGLCAQIKEDKSGLVWSLQAGRHTISNGRWAIRLDELPAEVRAVLHSRFAAEPSEGTHLSLLRGKVGTGCGTPGLDRFWEREAGMPAQQTALLMETEGERYRIFRCGGSFIYVAERHLRGLAAPSLAEADASEWKGIWRLRFREADYLVASRAPAEADETQEGFMRELLEPGMIGAPSKLRGEA